MAGELAVAHDDCVGAADRSGAGCQRVKQRNDGFLVGKCDVNAVKPEPAQAVQQRAQFLSVGPRYLNELIMAAQTKMTSRLFVHRW